MSDAPVPGTIGWIDLTVPDAVRVRDFYAAVVGWTATPVDMDGYEDFCVAPPGREDPVAGICHARGENATQPAQWMMYVIVTDLAASLDACRANGGTVVVGPREVGEARMAVIRDPAGAVVGLYQAE